MAEAAPGPDQDGPTAATAAAEAPLWLLLEAGRLGGARVAVVLEDPEHLPVTFLAAARAALPGVVIYFPREVEALAESAAAQDDGLLRAVHQAKREMGGWVVPGGCLGARVEG